MHQTSTRRPRLTTAERCVSCSNPTPRTYLVGRTCPSCRRVTAAIWADMTKPRRDRGVVETCPAPGLRSPLLASEPEASSRVAAWGPEPGDSHQTTGPR